MNEWIVIVIAIIVIIFIADSCDGKKFNFHQLVLRAQRKSQIEKVREWEWMRMGKLRKRKRTIFIHTEKNISIDDDMKLGGETRI